jgi:hypothetical protein
VTKTPRLDYLSASFDDLDAHTTGLLVFDAPEISAILRGHLLVERVVEALISQEMSSPDRFFKNQRVSFEMKIDLASALGVLPETHVSAAKAINKIRNSYAHNEEHKLTMGELNSLKIRWEPIQEKAYGVACQKGVEEAARVALIFLNWSFLNLLPQRASAPLNRDVRREHGHLQ